METTLLDPSTEMAVNQAYEFAKVHGKVLKVCDLLDNSIIKIRENIVSDDCNVIGSDLDNMACKVESIRKSTDLAECFEILKGLFDLYEEIDSFDQLWHFGPIYKSLFGILEDQLYNMYDILDEYGVHEDIKPE